MKQKKRAFTLPALMCVVGLPIVTSASCVHNTRVFGALNAEVNGVAWVPP